MDKVLNLATMFSGIGSIEHALRRLNINHKILFASDSDKYVQKSYFANYDIDKKRWYDDVRKIDGFKYNGEIDLLVGGSPCQSFSIAGNRAGFEDTRGTLFYEFARVIRESQPKIFIYENVKGLVNHDEGRTYETIKNTFTELGYTYHSKILAATDYGIPQSRNRIFIVGFKDGGDTFEFPQPTELKYTMQDFLEDFIDSPYYQKEKNAKVLENGELVFPLKTVDEKYYLLEKSIRYVMNTGTKGYNTKPETDLKIARTLLQTMHKMHRAGIDNYVSHTGRLRKLTPRECLRLMGFDDSFKIVVSDTQIYRQTGNSIVVNVFMELLKQIDIVKYSR